VDVKLHTMAADSIGAIAAPAAMEEAATAEAEMAAGANSQPE
jgi:hypothetical protein